MQAMILAAGFGKRLRPYSLIRPKPLFPVMGLPLILHLIGRLRNAGFDRILINCHHLPGQFHELLDDQPGVFLQDEKIELGTGGGLRLALPWFNDEPVLVMNGDIFHDYDPAAIFRSHQESGARISMVVHDYPRFNNVLVDDHRRISGFRRQTSRDRPMAYTGIQVIDPGLLGAISPGCFHDLIDYYQEIISLEEIRASWNDAPVYWRDMGTEADYLGLHHDLFKGRSALLHPESPFCVSPSARIDPTVELEGWAVIGDNVEIGSGCRVARSVIWDGVRVEAGSAIFDRVLGG